MWVAYSKPEDKTLPKIWLYSVATEARTEVTDGWYEGSAPAFSEDGKYLYFASRSQLQADPKRHQSSPTSTSTPSGSIW